MAKAAPLKVELTLDDKLLNLFDLMNGALKGLHKKIDELQRQIDELKETRHTHEGAPVGDNYIDWLSAVPHNSGIVNCEQTQTAPRRFEYPVN